MRTETNKPLYKTVVEETLHLLSGGAINVGHRLPPEADYAVEPGASRNTVREAFSQLEMAGDKKRRKRGGTEVIAIKPMQRFDTQLGCFSHPSALLCEALFNLSDISNVDQTAHPDLCQHQCESSK